MHEMRDELLELSIDDVERPFLEYERQFTRAIAEAFGMRPLRPLELYIPLVSAPDDVDSPGS